jgi:hypothetical protein
MKTLSAEQAILLIRALSKNIAGEGFDTDIMLMCLHDIKEICEASMKGKDADFWLKQYKALCATPQNEE